MAMRHLMVVLVALAAVQDSGAASCGKPYYQPKNRVIAGDNAVANSWPWTAALYYGGRFSCGGTLIHPNWVVTAAHCVYRRNYRFFRVVLGEHDRQHRSGKETFHRIAKIVVHRSYNKRRQLNNDIALMKLSTSAKLGPAVSPACLPNADKDVAVGTKCYVTGWGKIRHPGNSHRILQQAVLPVVRKDACNSKNSKYFPITDQMLCAGDGGQTRKSGCHGDSGGPLVCQREKGSAWTLEGVVSWGSPRCDTRDAYSVFARVTEFRKWIEDMMRKY